MEPGWAKEEKRETVGQSQSEDSGEEESNADDIVVAASDPVLAVSKPPSVPKLVTEYTELRNSVETTRSKLSKYRKSWESENGMAEIFSKFDKLCKDIKNMKIKINKIKEMFKQGKYKEAILPCLFTNLKDSEYTNCPNNKAYFLCIQKHSEWVRSTVESPKRNLDKFIKHVSDESRKATNKKLYTLFLRPLRDWQTTLKDVWTL